MIEIQRINMVKNQCKAQGIDDTRLLAALATIPREDFVAAKYRSVAYSDAEVPDLYGQTMSRPEMQALLLARADLKAEDSLVIIGSEYLATVAKHLVKEVQINPKTLPPDGQYNKIIVEGVIPEELLQQTPATVLIFGAENRGEGICQHLVKYYGNQKELLGEIYLLFTHS